jgi:F420-non-reducing hydrogenase iron-sulfur subunit
MKYPPNIHIVRIRCTGRINAGHILHAIRDGADGVMIVGCRKGECDFPDGNLKAARNVEFVKRVLDRHGLGSNRVNMYFLSAAEAERFVAAVEDILSKVEKLGPNPLKQNWMTLET